MAEVRLLGDKTEPGLGECPLSRPRLGSLYSGDLRPAGDRGRGVVRGALCEEAPPRGLRQRRELEGLRVGPAPGSGPRSPRGQCPRSRAAGPGQGSRDGGGVWPRAPQAGLPRLVWRTGKAFLQGRRSQPAEPGGCCHRAFSRSHSVSHFLTPWKSQPSLWLLCSILHTCTQGLDRCVIGFVGCFL